MSGSFWNTFGSVLGGATSPPRILDTVSGPVLGSVSEGVAARNATAIQVATVAAGVIGFPLAASGIAAAVLANQAVKSMSDSWSAPNPELESDSTERLALRERFIEELTFAKELNSSSSDFEECILATFATCLAFSNCDGEIAGAEREEILSVLGYIASDHYSAQLQDAVAALCQAPPSYDEAMLLVEKLEGSRWEPINTALLLLAEADNVVHANEDAFLAMWSKAFEHRSAKIPLYDSTTESLPEFHENSANEEPNKPQQGEQDRLTCMPDIAPFDRPQRDSSNFPVSWLLWILLLLVGTTTTLTIVVRPPYDWVDAAYGAAITFTAALAHFYYRLTERREKEQARYVEHLSSQYAQLVHVVGSAFSHRHFLANDHPNDTTWTFEKDGVVREYEPGRILRVNDTTTEIEHVYTYSENGSVTCDVFHGEKRRYRIHSSKHGAPIYGASYDEMGELLVEYRYDTAGQLASRESKIERTL